MRSSTPKRAPRTPDSRTGRYPSFSAHLLEMRGGLVFKAHGLSYHSTLGVRVIKQKKKVWHLAEDAVLPVEVRRRVNADGKLEARNDPEGNNLKRFEDVCLKKGPGTG